MAPAGAGVGGRLGRKMLGSIQAKGTHGPEVLGTGGEQAGADELLSNRVGNFSHGTFQRQELREGSQRGSMGREAEGLGSPSLHSEISVYVLLKIKRYSL